MVLYFGQALAHLVKAKGMNNTFILSMNNTLGNSIATQFNNTYIQQGGTVDGWISYNSSSSSFTSQINSIKTNNSSAVVLISYASDAISIITEAQSQSLKVTWFASYTLLSNSFLSTPTIENYLNGTIFETTPTTGFNLTNSLYTQFISDLASTGGSFSAYGDYA